MMIPMTKFKLFDESAPTPIAQNVPTIPVCVAAFASDKGDEKFRYIYGDEFYKVYGKNISFEKYGQPLLQAARIIDAGGSILSKRVVASDATLANIGIFLNISEVDVQAVDNKGNKIYLDSTGADTITVTATPKMVKNCELKYSIKTCANKQNVSAINAQLESFTTEDDITKKYTYLLFTIADTGRGKSNKKIKISPDYMTSKKLSYMDYNFQELELNDEVVETLEFSLKPDVIENNENKFLQNVISLHSNQVVCLANEANLNSAYQKISNISGVALETVKGYDLIFAKDNKNNDLDNIILNLIDPDAINLSYPYGIALQSGDNGAFGDNPLVTTEYSNQLVNFFNGTFTSDIYDLDNYKIDLIIDANYPNEVKRAIESLCSYRGDVEYFEDMGLGLKSMEDILSVEENVLRDKCVALYHLSYDVINPYTKKQISVTVGYSLANLLITHFLNGRTRPLAGELYNFTIDEAIEGTVNFIPKITPSYDEKQICLDNRVNYASYFSGRLVIETLLTTQEKETQMSFINNNLAIQEIIKAVRTKCPKIRYSFIDKNDYTNYKQDVDTELNKYAGNFATLKMQYMQDPSYEQNKIFYATISVVFKNFVQTEYFEIYALRS